ncbi:MAG: hypothetical protein JSS51_10405 [Planctomycetes bacterium]|nr:hypothetical protein [Planctomycetota bacterium]
MPAAELILAWFDRHRVWLLAFAGLLVVAAFSTAWRVTPDSALFLGLARNLALGRGFTFNEQIVSTVNPGFPHLLAILFRAGGDPIAVANAFILLTSLASLVLVFALMHAHAGRPLAVLITFLTAINSTFHRHTGEILADMPFFFFCMLALLGYELTFARPDRRPARIVAGGIFTLLGLAGMAWLRLVFIAPLGAIVADLAWRVRRSRFKWAILAAAGAVLLGAVAVRLADPRMAGGLTLLAKEREVLESFRNLPATLQRTGEFTAPRLLTDVTPRALFGNKVGVWPIDGVVSILVFAAGLMLVKRRIAWAVLVAICLAQWLLFYPDSRYFLPIIPLLLLGWWDLGVKLTSYARPARQAGALAAFVALLLIPNLVRAFGFVLDQRRTPFLEHYMRGRFRDLPALAAQAASTLPPDAVIIADEQFASPMHYLSGRRTIAVSGALLLGDRPPGRPAFVLISKGSEFDGVLSRAGLRQAAIVLGDPQDPAALRVLALEPLPAPARPN